MGHDIFARADHGESEAVPRRVDTVQPAGGLRGSNPGASERATAEDLAVAKTEPERVECSENASAVRNGEAGSRATEGCASRLLPVSAAGSARRRARKSAREHRFPLSGAALWSWSERADWGAESRAGVPGIQGKTVGAAVFGRLLKDLEVDCSPHGFRSSFRSWCSDEGIDRDLAEQAWLTRSAARSSSAIRGATLAGGHGVLGRVPGRLVHSRRVRCYPAASRYAERLRG